MHDEDVLTHVESFLRNVHTKNPILEPTELLTLARGLIETGFQFDDNSCLVLITCALGSLSTDWSLAVPDGMATSLSDAETYPLAEAYYTAARKRLGLLETSIQATQCWFLIGIYEMYSMRPMRAWLSFDRACTIFRLKVHPDLHSTRQAMGQVEQRLYWSCVKSEAEMREEFDLPNAGLSLNEYPEFFPSPPEAAPYSSNGEHISQDTPLHSVHQRGWYYYLSDIAYRQICVRVIATLYAMPQEQWPSVGVKRLHRWAEELDKQILQWWQHIPGAPAPEFEHDPDELTYMLRLCYGDLRERVWRPFLYVAIHDTTLSETESSLAMTNAARCLELSFVMLEGARLKHRHHGCWLTIRCMFTKALLVLAAVKSGRVELRNDWRKHVNAFQTYLQYWEVEAPDMASMRSALSELLLGVQNHPGG